MVIDFDELGCCLVVRPLADPAFVQSGALGQVGRGERLSCRLQCLIEAELIPQVDHASRHGGKAFVYNGVDPSEFVFRRVKGDYDLFLGRLHSVKGYRWAMAGAKRSGRRLLVAGGWRLSLRRSLRFVGAVNGERKADLLASAACLWMPALWDEPFGLTLVEAMMSGTPVLGTRRGALPEVVTHDVGALGDTLDELIELRSTIERLDPGGCRARAERWFSHTRMAEEYVRMYQHYLASGNLPEGRVTT